jgi:hypothetical protein
MRWCTVDRACRSPQQLRVLIIQNKVGKPGLSQPAFHDQNESQHDVRGVSFPKCHQECQNKALLASELQGSHEAAPDVVLFDAKGATTPGSVAQLALGFRQVDNYRGGEGVGFFTAMPDQILMPRRPKTCSLTPWEF